MKRIIIVGGGSCGLATASALVEITKNYNIDINITLIEHKDKLGKKLLATGNGRCNLANKNIAIENYTGHDVEKIAPLILDFNTQEFLENLGLWTKYMGELLYPQSEQAISVLNCFTNIINSAVDVRLNESVNSIKYQNQEFEVITNNQKYYADYVIVTTGSDIASHFGSDGSGFELLSNLGHRIFETVPSLVQLKCHNMDQTLKGVRIHGLFTLYVDGRALHKEKGEILFTDYGLSGISILQLSKYFYQYPNSLIEIGVDCLDAYTETELYLKLTNQLNSENKIHLSNIINQKYANYLEKELPKEYSYKELNLLVKLLKDKRFKVVGTKSKKDAQVGIGGANLIEFDTNTLESKLIDNLFVGGEVLDVAGDCGGYNLHFAFACANAIVNEITRKLFMED